MKNTIVIIFSLIYFNVSGKENLDELIKPIVAEGKWLYRSEIASWYGTDLFLDKYEDKKNVGGYFSYPDEDFTKCIFFSKSENPKVIGTIFFDNTLKSSAAKLDLTEREFTEFEREYYIIRQSALSIINSDTLFKAYDDSNLNLIPMITKDAKKVYVITGPVKSGVVLLGNDYLITFSNDNQLISKKRIHKSLIRIEFGKSNEKSEDKEEIGAAHSHLPGTGDFITPTDICTLMLYEKIAKWEVHYIVTPNYVNIWNCLKDELMVYPKEEFDKMMNSGAD